MKSVSHSKRKETSFLCLWKLAFFLSSFLPLLRFKTRVHKVYFVCIFSTSVYVYGVVFFIFNTIYSLIYVLCPFTSIQKHVFSHFLNAIEKSSLPSVFYLANKRASLSLSRSFSGRERTSIRDKIRTVIIYRGNVNFESFRRRASTARRKRSFPLDRLRTLAALVRSLVSPSPPLIRRQFCPLLCFASRSKYYEGEHC